MPKAPATASKFIRTAYPKAHIMFLPGLTPAPDIIASVITKKADITQQNPAFSKILLKSNPSSLKQVTPPLMVFPTSIVVVPKGDYELKEWLDLAIQIHDRYWHDGCRSR